MLLDLSRLALVLESPVGSHRKIMQILGVASRTLVATVHTYIHIYSSSVAQHCNPYPQPSPRSWSIRIRNGSLHERQCLCVVLEPLKLNHGRIVARGLWPQHRRYKAGLSTCPLRPRCKGAEETFMHRVWAAQKTQRKIPTNNSSNTFTVKELMDRSPGSLVKLCNAP